MQNPFDHSEPVAPARGRPSPRGGEHSDASDRDLLRVLSTNSVEVDLRRPTQNPFNIDNREPPEKAEEPPSPSPDGSGPANPFLVSSPHGELARTRTAQAEKVDLGFSFGGEGATPEGLANKRAELEELEATLRRRERALQVREEALSLEGKPDWPPCCPFLQHDIERDIAHVGDEERRAVIFGYRVFLANAVLFWVNLACQFAFSAGSDNDDKFKAVGLAALYILFGTPGAFFLWYYTFFTGVRSSNSKLYLVALCMLACSILFWAVHCVGVLGTGMAGVILLFDQWDASSEISDAYAACAILTVLFIALAAALIVASVMLWRQIRVLQAGKPVVVQTDMDNATLQRNINDAARASGQSPTAMELLDRGDHQGAAKMI